MPFFCWQMWKNINQKYHSLLLRSKEILMNEIKSTSTLFPYKYSVLLRKVTLQKTLLTMHTTSDDNCHIKSLCGKGMRNNPYDWCKTLRGNDVYFQIVPQQSYNTVTESRALDFSKIFVNTKYSFVSRGQSNGGLGEVLEVILQLQVLVFYKSVTNQLQVENIHYKGIFL